MKVYNKLANYLYRYPIGHFKTLIKYGGPFKKIAVNKGRKEMRDAALNLKFSAPDENAKEVEVPICFLTGKNHWYLTAFCIYSLMKHTREYIFNFIIFDDGSLDQDIIKYFTNHIPRIKIIQKEDIEKNLEREVAENLYPEIRQLRRQLLIMRKITDIHSSIRGKIIFLDSDMLFFKKPLKMIEWAVKPTGVFFMRDNKQSYGIDLNLMAKVAGTHQIPEQFNAGLYGIDTNNTDFALVEKWIVATKNPNGLGNYYWEQALTAMLIAQDVYEEISATDYIVKPTKQQVENMTGVLHHYVEVSQNLYYTKAWRLAI